MGGGTHCFLSSKNCVLCDVIRIGPGALNDLRSFNPSDLTWVDISVVAYGARPEPRILHGFASAGNKLYVHGGLGENG